MANAENVESTSSARWRALHQIDAGMRNRLRGCEHMRACSADSLEEAVARRNVKKQKA
jgi:hypothetical protein